MWVRSRRPDGSVVHTKRRVRPRKMQIAGDLHDLRAYREALLWWQQVLVAGISVPLAPRNTISQRDRKE